MSKVQLRSAVRWGLGALCASGLGLPAPARGDVVCYEREITIEAQSGCVNVTMTPQRPDSAALQKVRAECEAELERQKDALLNDYIRQCEHYLEQTKQQGEQMATLERELAKIEMSAEWSQQQEEWSQKQAEWQAETARIAGERDRLQAAAAAAVARPGSQALAEFPAGAATGRLAGFGLLAAVGGFCLGLPGRSRWLRKLLSGLMAALLALVAYGFWVAWLPDTQQPHLLLAVTAALLLISLRTLLRAFLLLRQRRPPAP